MSEKTKKPELVTIVADLLAGVPALADESIDVCFTSPPYFRRDGWSPELGAALGALLGRVLKPGARAFIVVGSVSENFALASEVLTSVLEGSSRSNLPESSWLQPWQEFAWIKSIAIDGVTRGHFQSIGGKDLAVNYCWEKVLQVVKGDPKQARPLDRLSVGVPFACKGNLTRGTRGKNGDLHCSGDAVFVPYVTTGKTTKKTHRHAFPLALAHRFLRLANVPKGGRVLDPFSGGGSTVVAAQALGLDSVAVDIDPTAIEETRKAYELAEAAEPYTQEVAYAFAFGSRPPRSETRPATAEERGVHRDAKPSNILDSFPRAREVREGGPFSL